MIAGRWGGEWSLRRAVPRLPTYATAAAHVRFGSTHDRHDTHAWQRIGPPRRRADNGEIAVNQRESLRPDTQTARTRRSANQHHARLRDLSVTFQVSASALADATPRIAERLRQSPTDTTNRHPRLDPGSRYLLPPRQRSGTPDQVRGDESMSVKLVGKRLSPTFHVSRPTRQQPVAIPCVGVTLA